MDSSAISWRSEMVPGNQNFTDQYDFMDSFDEEIAAILRGDFESCLSPENNSSASSISAMSIKSVSSSSTSPPAMPENSSIFSTFQGLRPTPHQASSTPIILNFGNTNANSPGNAVLNPDEEAVVSEVLRTPASEEVPKRAECVKRTTRIRPPSQTYDHIIAERKRRELLSQHFLALSTIIPGLKKMDKTSVLGNAIKYLQYLQERVETLEAQATQTNMESAVLVKKSKIMVDDDEKDRNPEEQPLPEIEARVCNSQILIRIQCENRKGLLTNLISQVEKLHLTIVNTNVTSFGMLALEITIITKMEKDFDLTVNEVLKRLHAAIKHAL